MQRGFVTSTALLTLVLRDFCCSVVRLLTSIVTYMSFFYIFIYVGVFIYSISINFFLSLLSLLYSLFFVQSFFHCLHFLIFLSLFIFSLSSPFLFLFLYCFLFFCVHAWDVSRSVAIIEAVWLILIDGIAVRFAQVQVSLPRQRSVAAWEGTGM